MNIYIVAKSNKEDSSIEDVISKNNDKYIYIPISIFCPFFIVKTKESKKEFSAIFEKVDSFFLEAKLIESGIIKIDKWNNQIIETLKENRILNYKNTEDIDEIFYLISEFGFDFLNFEQKDTLELYSKSVN